MLARQCNGGPITTPSFTAPRTTPSLIVPADAIIFNAGGVQVAAVDNGIVRLHKIAIARDLGRQVEVRDGVKPGDQLILNPPVYLIDGARVRIRPSPA